MRERRRHPPPGPREPPFEGPQIVGQRCAHCEHEVAFYTDAQWCPHCTRAVHDGCLADHLTHRDGPFR